MPGFVWKTFQALTVKLKSMYLMFVLYLTPILLIYPITTKATKESTPVVVSFDTMWIGGNKIYGDCWLILTYVPVLVQN